MLPTRAGVPARVGPGEPGPGLVSSSPLPILSGCRSWLMRTPAVLVMAVSSFRGVGAGRAARPGADVRR